MCLAEQLQAISLCGINQRFVWRRTKKKTHSLFTHLRFSQASFPPIKLACFFVVRPQVALGHVLVSDERQDIHQVFLHHPIGGEGLKGGKEETKGTG